MTTPQYSADQASTWLRPDQVQRLRTACYEGSFQSDLRRRNDALITVLYDTGLRVGTLVQLSVDHLDLDAGTIRRPSGDHHETGDTAQESPSVLHLDQSHLLGTTRLLISYLSDREGDDTLLFPSRDGGHLTAKAARDVVTKAATTADVCPDSAAGRREPSDVSPQTIRHSTAWRMLNVENRSMEAVRDRLGHTAISTTKSLYAGFDAAANQERSRNQPREETGLSDTTILDEILDAVPDILYAFDTDGQLIWWNDRVREVTGYTDAKIAETHPLEFIAQENRIEIAETISKIVDGDSVGPTETLLVTKDGEYLAYEFTGEPITNAAGTVQGVAGVGRDISGRKRFERISDGFYALDTDWRFTYLNPRAETLLGRSTEELLGSVVWEEFPEAADLAVYEEFHTAMETLEATAFDQYYPPLDTWFSVRVYPSDTGLSVYFKDITERKERERELEQYRTLTEAATEVIVTIDDDGIIRSVNPAAREVFGHTPEELRGEPLTMLMPDDLAARHREALERFLEAGEQTMDWTNTELPGVRADGTEIPMAISFSEATYDDERFFTGIIRDITERKARERDLAVQNALLEAQIETTIHGLLVTDVDRNVVYHNERFLEMWDIPGQLAATRSDELLLEFVHDQLADPEGFREKIEYLYEHPEEESRDTVELAGGRWFDRYSAPIVTDGTRYGRLWVFRDITEQKERERTLEQHRTELAQLNQFNELVGNLIHRLVDESTRTEIEQTVCDQLASSDFYEAAWIGEQGKTARTVEPSVSAGVDLDAELARSASSPEGTSPYELAAKAMEERAVRVVQETRGEQREDGDRSPEAGIESVLAVPIEHGNVLYGVLVVYATRSEAIGDRQQSSFVDLGETIGFVLAAAERKEALVSERVLELSLSVSDPEQFFIQVATHLDATVTLDGIVARGGGGYIEYFTVTGPSPDAIREFSAQWDHHDYVRVVDTDSSGCLCEVGVSDSAISPTVAEYGGTVTHMTATDECGTVRVELPQTADVSRAFTAIDSVVADVELEAKLHVDRPIQTIHRFQADVTNSLTDKQRNALEAAYLAGFFEHPRYTTGEEVAESLNISPSTFHQHLRVGLQKLVGPLFDTASEAS